ncbi:MAG: ADP-ribosylation factor-like protein [Polyangiaceae bacterium]|jgi:signal recognition particle receptor subunit beta|nr:ADP-ribosylation factor-like protein [Polyangiaceae bacterium]
MPFVNFMSREINCKLVYYGPGLCGKTTNLKYIYERANPDNRGKLISLATETERTLFFDFLPIDLGNVRGFKVRLQLYTVPGQVFYDASRKLILRGADGVVFVADSQEMREEANIESMENLEENLKEHGLQLEKIPFVIQYNKRDLPDVLPVEHLRGTLNPRGVPDHEAIAHKGDGVFETLKSVSKLVLAELSSGGFTNKKLARSGR